MRKFTRYLVPVWIITLSATIAGTWMHILHYPFSDVLLATGLIAYLLFFVGCLYEINASTRVDHRTKVRWTTGFLLFSGLAGLLYVCVGRRRIADHVR